MLLGVPAKEPNLAKQRDAFAVIDQDMVPAEKLEQKWLKGRTTVVEPQRDFQFFVRHALASFFSGSNDRVLS